MEETKNILDVLGIELEHGEIITEDTILELTDGKGEEGEEDGK